jgi:hypothetical protein
MSRPQRLPGAHFWWLMPLALSACTQLAQPCEAATPPAEQPAYAAISAKYFSSTMADRASFENFEISGLRWVHALKGDVRRSGTVAVFGGSFDSIIGRCGFFNWPPAERMTRAG